MKQLEQMGWGIAIEGGVFEGLVAVLAALGGREPLILVVDGAFLVRGWAG